MRCFQSLWPILTALSFACSSSSETADPGGTPLGGASGNAGQGVSGSSGHGQYGGAGYGGSIGGTDPGGGQGGDSVGLAGKGGAGGSLFQQCATGAAEAKARPVDLYVMLDRSGSMVGPKWTAVSSGLSDFFANPGTSDLRIGLQFFPLDGSQVCDYKSYGNPVIPIGVLPDIVGELQEKLSKQDPSGETPTLPALQGAYEFTKGWAQSNPERAVAVLLATDGEPNVCASTLDKVEMVAKNAKNSEPSIATFVIGVGDLSKLDAVAKAGGTSKAFLVDGSGASTKEQLVKALGQIRDALVLCSFPLPSVAGKDLNLNEINVTLTPPDGGVASPIYKSSSLSACSAENLEWYYDPPEAPTQVSLCPTACAALKAQAGTKVDLIFGCASLIK